MRLAVAFVLVLFTSCSKSPANPPPASPEQAGQGQGDAAEPAGGKRPELTAAACEKGGGKVVGDIGDGAIHRPDYRCPDSGQPPIGSIAPEPGGPVAVEGAVCCK